mgnify:FL=1
MLFKKVFVRWSAGENVDPANVPQPLKDYCQSLQDVPPQYEVFIGDPDIDSKTPP